MSFTIKRRESYSWTVEHVVGRQGGRPELMSFDAEFKALPQSGVENMSQRMRKGKMKDDQFLDEVLVGWHDLEDEQGKAFEYSKINLAALLEIYPGLAGSIMTAWFESVLGGTIAAVGAAARKN